MIPTWKVAEAKMSVGVNGAFIPFKSAPDAMRRFVRPALFSTGHEDWELRLSGTAVLCRYRRLSIAVATDHQTGDGNEKPLPNKFVVLGDGGRKTLAIPPKTVRRPLIGDEEYQSLQDLCLFDFEERVNSHCVEALDLSFVLWSDTPGVTVDYSFLIGYPTRQVRRLSKRSHPQLHGSDCERGDFGPIQIRVTTAESRLSALDQFRCEA